MDSKRRGFQPLLLDGRNGKVCIAIFYVEFLPDSTYLPELVATVGCYTLINTLTHLLLPFTLSNRFRQEYRLEKKVLNELSIDPETFPVDNEELSNLIATTTTSQPNSRHYISRVVVLHNDKLETFFNPNEKEKPFEEELPVGEADFFDNDSFWSGSLTWY